MYREWSIVGGPLDLTTQDVGQPRTFRIAVDPDTAVDLVVTIAHVGKMFGGKIRSFSGTVMVDHKRLEIIGTYNVRDRTGHLQTTDPRA